MHVHLIGFVFLGVMCTYSLRYMQWASQVIVVMVQLELTHCFCEGR